VTSDEERVAEDETVDSEPAVRRAGVGDARGIASISVRGWQAAYRNILPQTFLEEMSLAARTSAWRSYLGSQSPDHRMWVIEREGTILGFCRTGPCEDVDVGEGVAEVHGLYLDPRLIGRGLGRELFAHALEDLRVRRFKTCVLWTFAGNERAEQFYRAAGFELDGAERDWQAGGGSPVTAVERRFRLAFDAR
jgi:ribosomal protein S18 acetylase RimI-like enzyme